MKSKSFSFSTTESGDYAEHLQATLNKGCFKNHFLSLLRFKTMSNKQINSIANNANANPERNDLDQFTSFPIICFSIMKGIVITIHKKRNIDTKNLFRFLLNSILFSRFLTSSKK